MRTFLLVMVLLGIMLLLSDSVSAVSSSRYVLGEPIWRVNGEASGSGYVLSDASAPTVDSCCCIYLPCVLRKP